MDGEGTAYKTQRIRAMKLKGKVAVITGGSSGIGLAIAREFKAQGAQLAILGRDEKALDRAAGVVGKDTLPVKGDVTNLSDIERLYSVTREKFGKLDIVVANAGVAKLAPIEAVDEEFFDYISDINFKGLFFTVQRAATHLSDGASVVLVSSGVNQLGLPNFSVYSATKAAVRSLARSFTAEFLPRGIRVNVLSPGPIETPIFEKMGVPEEAMEEMGRNIREMNPMKRFGTPEEMAKAALFLASSDSSYMAGAELVADGGVTQL